MPADSSIRAVIAEDEAIIRMDLREILEEEGYVVVGECGRGDEVLGMVEELRPDLAVLDVKMPGMDGISVARELAGSQRCAVVLLTAFSQRELIADARDAGVGAYVVKPFQRSDLVPAIEIALGRFAEVASLAERAAELAEKLEVRKLVDRAKGRLLDEFGLNEAESFKFLQRTAMDERRPVSSVCEDVIAGTLRP